MKLAHLTNFYSGATIGTDTYHGVVVQWLERQIVDLIAVGSSPIDPRKRRILLSFFFLKGVAYEY